MFNDVVIDTNKPYVVLTYTKEYIPTCSAQENQLLNGTHPIIF